MGHAVTLNEAEALHTEAADSVELFVPGRLCLFGEHSDWAGSYARHAFCRAWMPCSPSSRLAAAYTEAHDTRQTLPAMHAPVAVPLQDEP